MLLSGVPVGLANPKNSWSVPSGQLAHIEQKLGRSNGLKGLIRDQIDFRFSGGASSALQSGLKTESQPVLGQSKSSQPLLRSNLRFGNDSANTLSMRQTALARVWGMNPLGGPMTLESLRQSFVDANWRLMAQVVVLTKEEPDRETALMRAIDLGEVFLSKMSEAIRPTCSQEEATLLSNETVMLFVAQALDWGENLQEQMDQPQYNRNVAAKLGLGGEEPSPNQVIMALQAKTSAELRQIFELP